jgi:L-fucose mutarotase
MLKGIPGCLSPELLSVLAMMGHGDEIVLADADFPAYRCSQRVLRADGVEIAPLLAAILPLFPLDSFVENPIAIMAPVDKAAPEPKPWGRFREIVKPHFKTFTDFEYVERFAFYDRAKQAFAVVVTSEPDGNLILKKGPVA